MPAVRPLTVAMTSTFPRAVPGSVFTLGPVLTVLVNLALVPSDVGYPTYDELVGLEPWLVEPVFGALLAGCFLGWWAPWLAAACAALVSADVPVLVLAWSALILLDATRRHRQRDVVDAWLGGVAPTRPVGRLPRPRPVLHLVSVGALLLGASVAALMAWQGREAVVAMHERGVETPGEVVSTDTFDDSLVVDVEGREHDFWVLDASTYRPGQQVVVLTDPEGRYRPVGFGDFDPDDGMFTLVAAGALLGGAAAVHVLVPRRWRRVTHTGTEPSPALQVLVAENGRSLEVHAVDAEEWATPFLLLSAPLLTDGDEDEGAYGLLDRAIHHAQVLTPDDMADRDADLRVPAVLRGFRAHGDSCVLEVDGGLAAVPRPTRDGLTPRFVAARWWARVRPFPERR